MSEPLSTQDAKVKYGPQPTGEVCYCGFQNTPMTCAFPTCGGRAKVKLNVGCGRNILPGWINLDSVELPGVDIVHDIDSRAPLSSLGDSSIDEFLLSHIIEHLYDPLLAMQKLHRIAKPGAKMVIRTPYGSSDDAWEDPTHVRPYFLNSFSYFSQPFYWRADYGYRGDWRVKKIMLAVPKDLVERYLTYSREIMIKVYTQRNVVTEMIAELEAVKPIREPLKELQEALNVELVSA